MNQLAAESAPYDVVAVDQTRDIELLQGVLSMWLRNGAMEEPEARRRLNEVICVIRHIASGTVVGVSTAYVSLIPGVTKRIFLYRMFIDPAHRGKTHQNHIVSTTVEVLRQRQHVDQTLGVVAILENHRVPDRLMLSLGWTNMNRFWKGNRLYCIPFGEQPVHS